MKFPIGTKVFAIFNEKVNGAEVRKQSRLYREYVRLNFYDQKLRAGNYAVPMIIDLHPDDVFEDEDAAKKALFERKLRGIPSRYGDEDE